MTRLRKKLSYFFEHDALGLSLAGLIVFGFMGGMVVAAISTVCEESGNNNVAVWAIIVWIIVCLFFVVLPAFGKFFVCEHDWMYLDSDSRVCKKCGQGQGKVQMDEFGDRVY